MRRLLLVISVGLMLSACGGVDGLLIPTANPSRPDEFRAWLDKPPGEGRFPAIILLHGCGGLELDTPFRMVWKGLKAHAEALNQAGFVTLITDSYAVRGYSTRELERASCLDGRVAYLRMQDLYGAIDYLRQQPFVQANAIGAVGLSQGGKTVLHASSVSEQRYRGYGIQAGVALYPPCYFGEPPFAVPLLIMIGEADDITPASMCRDLAARAEFRHQARTRSGIADPGIVPEYVGYPGAYHSYDLPLLSKHPSFLGTVAPDPAALADTRKRMIAFFRAHLKE